VLGHFEGWQQNCLFLLRLKSRAGVRELGIGLTVVRRLRVRVLHDAGAVGVVLLLLNGIDLVAPVAVVR
jgi:hypothetical protein